MKEIKITTPVKFRHMIFPGLKAVLHNDHISLISYAGDAEFNEFKISEKEVLKLKKVIEKWVDETKSLREAKHARKANGVGVSSASWHYKKSGKE
ncbi:MAG: hypothetical protein QW734_06475 [Candidatus Bathyarchaeia archaeon]